MRNPGGYLRIECEDGRIIELDSVTCSHCNRIIPVKPGQGVDTLGGYCGGCSKYVCANCVGKGCDEIERKLERWEASYHARRSYGL
jgi:hypothetical protein